MNFSQDLPRTHTSVAELAVALRDSYATTLRLVGDLSSDRWLGPQLSIVNPPLWEVGHIAWFMEHWVLRRETAAQSLVAGADALYDSSRVAHATRWSLSLPHPQDTLTYLARATNAVLQVLDTGGIAEPNELYYVELSVCHQDMHNEALRYTRQTLSYRDPLGAGPQAPAAHTSAPGDVRIPDGRLMLGATRSDGFVFDNEKWGHEVDLPAFAIARRAVSNQEFLAFVEDAGYDRREFWDDAGWQWREAQGRGHPVYWRRAERWQQRVFDRWQPVEPDLPVIHVSAFEADAYCRWAGRRLPSEAEWERAAATRPGSGVKLRYPWGDAPADAARCSLGSAGPAAVDAYMAGDSGWGCRQMLGNVWEWTGSTFMPYPGFCADPYVDYSLPWFGSHRVLRGGSYATPPRLARCTLRNFYTPDRSDIFAGFRTCAL